MAEGRLRIYNRRGKPLVEIPASVNVAWILGEVAKGQFTIATADSNCRRRYFRYGYFVTYEHPRLETWGGVMAPHGAWEWDGDGSLTVTLLTAEVQLMRCRGPELSEMKGRAGDVFEELINTANDVFDTRLRVDDVPSGGPFVDATSRDGILYALLEGIRDQCGWEWWFAPSFDEKGDLYFAARWQKKIRANRQPYALMEGINIETPTGTFCRVEGEIVNDMVATGEGGTTASKPRARYVDHDSLDEHGRWQGVEATQFESQEAVDTYVQEQVNLQKDPPRTFRLTAIESAESPNTFRYIRVGATMRLYLYSVGFWSGSSFGIETDVRIIAAEYDSDENKMAIVSEEIVPLEVVNA